VKNHPIIPGAFFAAMPGVTTPITTTRQAIAIIIMVIFTICITAQRDRGHRLRHGTKYIEQFGTERRIFMCDHSACIVHEQTNGCAPEDVRIVV
jgi:hypothetical protein